MKKILIPIVLLAALWLGSTAYIGSQAEPELQNFISKMNKRTQSSGFKYVATTTKSSFFGSDVQLKLEPTNEAMKKLFDTSKLEIPMHISYGPVLFGGKPVLGLANAHYDISLKEYLPTLSPDIKLDEFVREGDIKLSLDFRVGVDKNLHAVADSEPFTLFAADSMESKISKMHGESNVDMDTLVGNGSFEIPSIVVAVESQDSNKSENFELLNTKATWNVTEIIDDFISLGRVNIGSEKFNIYEDDKLVTSIIPSSFMIVKRDGNNTIGVSAQINYKHVSGKYLTPDIPLENVQIGYEVGGMGIEGLNQGIVMIQKIQEAQNKMLVQLSAKNNDPDAFEKAMSDMEASMPKENEILTLVNNLLLKDKTYISLSSKMDTNQSQDNSAQAKVLLVKDIPAATLDELKATLADKTKLLEMIALDADISLQEQFLKDIDKSGMLVGQLDKALNEGFVLKNADRYVTKIEYKPNSLMINNKDNPQILMMIKMMIGAI